MKKEQNFEQPGEVLIAVLDSINASIYVADLEDYKIKYVNKKFTDIWGDNNIGKKCYQVLYNFDKPCRLCPNKKLLTEDGAASGELSFEHYNKKINRWHDYQIKAVKWTDSRMAKLSISTDITDRKQAEEKLRESKEKLSAIFNNMTDVVWSLSWPDLTHNYLSPSLKKLYGRSEQEFIDNPTLFKEITHPDDQYLTEIAMKQLIEHGEAERECRIIKPDGSIVWVNDRSKMIYDEKHQPIRVEGVT